MARYVGGIILAPVRANMARDVFICTSTKKNARKDRAFCNVRAASFIRTANH